MRKWLDPNLVGYLLLILLNLALVRDLEMFPVEEAVAISFVIGVGFSLIAYFLSRNSSPIIHDKGPQLYEPALLGFLVVVLTLLIVAGNKPLELTLPS